MPQILKTERLGEKRMMNCGMECTIIKYNTSKNIDVMFTDGVVVTNRFYKSFKAGNIKHRAVINPKHIGEKRMMNCGMECKITTYRRNSDIDVEFTDGTIVAHKYYCSFIRGQIQNPNLSGTPQHMTHLGEKRIMNCGMECEIIKYRKNNDIDIKFTDDNTIVQHKQYAAFTRGEIGHPNIHTTIKNNNRINKTKMMNCGMKCTITQYHNCNDMDIQFEDGTIVTHTKYSRFIHGQIRNPNQHLYETRKMNCGINCKIIKHHSSRNIDVQFSDGTIVTNRDYKSFISDRISHPLLKSFKKQYKPIYKTTSNRYYICTCKICKSEQILTPTEMVEHIHKYHPGVVDTKQ